MLAISSCFMKAHVTLQLMLGVEQFAALGTRVLVAVGKMLRLEVVLHVVLHAEALATNSTAEPFW